MRRTAMRVGLGLAVLGILLSYTPPAVPRFRLCGFYWLTGIPCPLCGLTRGLFALAKGHWRQAVGFNALTPLAGAMLASLWWDGAWKSRLWRAGLAAFAVYGVLRVFLPGV